LSLKSTSNGAPGTVSGSNASSQIGDLVRVFRTRENERVVSMSSGQQVKI